MVQTTKRTADRFEGREVALFEHGDGRSIAGGAGVREVEVAGPETGELLAHRLLVVEAGQNVFDEIRVVEPDARLLAMCADDESFELRGVALERRG